MYKIINVNIIKIIFLLVCSIFIPLSAQSGQQLEKVVFAMEAGLFHEALNQLAIAQSKEPNNAEIYKLKALLLEATNENRKAIDSWNNCIKNTKNSDLINEAKIHLKNLQEN
tara:strand:+ start:982 stop:1317 length:336 start_codon:yes stop_codon:yes gene_type:complete